MSLTRQVQQDHCDSQSIITAAEGKFDWLSNHGESPWDAHRRHARLVGEQYWAAPPDLWPKFHRKGDLIKDCSPRLSFTNIVDAETGECGLRFSAASFCRVRHCPVCEWRRSLKWAARLHQILPAVERLHPGARWIFLTLTVKNPTLADLRSTLKLMRAAWAKMLRYKEFPALGGTLALEITKGRDGNPHPHYHCLLLVPKSYFQGKNYLSQDRWRDLWQRAAKLQYEPSVNVKAVKGEDMAGSIAEAVKYTTKPADMAEDPTWLWSMTEALHRVRAVEAFGVLKPLLKDLDELEEEGPEEGNEAEADQLTFDWYPSRDRYGRRR